MSKAVAIITDQTRRLKARAGYSAVIASLFAGGGAGSIVWSVNGLPPLASVLCMTTSIVATVMFGLRVPGSLMRHSWLRQLNAIKQEVAVSLNMFPERSEHDAIVMSIRSKNAWERIENKAVGAYFTDNQILQMYERLRQVNGAASIRFSEASFKSETVSSADEFEKIQREFRAVQALTERVQERYREVISVHTHGRRLDPTPDGLKRLIYNTVFTATEHLKSSKVIMDVVLKYGGIDPKNHARIIDTLARLQPLVSGVLVSPSQRRDAKFELELVDLEIEAYASDRDLRIAGYTRDAS